jgi:methylglutaconyl-CoA hydratase
MDEVVLLEKQDSVATVTLNRPEVRNAFNAATIDALRGTFDTLSRREDIRVVVLRGNGRAFCAGADVEWMQASLDLTQAENVEDAERMSDMFRALDSLPQPVIARVHGAALGGGMGLVAAADIVIAAANSLFGFTEVKLGIIPAVISRVVLPKLGGSWARALYLTGERFGPEAARAAGLVHWIVPEERLDAEVEAKVAEILSSGPAAVRAAKRLIHDLNGLGDDAMRRVTAERIAELRTAPEGQEGLRAFLDKRRPGWQIDG